MLDGEGREINYLRISVTDLCNLRCKYCIPEEGVVKKCHSSILTLEEIEKIVVESTKVGINKVRLTGGEPLVRRGIVELVDKISNIEGINEIALTTNGILLKKYAADLKKAGLKRVNISLDTLNKYKYEYITRGGNLQDVLRGIEAAKKAGLFPLKLNIVLIKGFNDDEIENFVNLTLKNEIDIRFIELMPIGDNSWWAQKHFISNNIVLNRNPSLIPIDNKDKSSPAKHYKLPNAKGRVGLINPISSHFCSNCNRLRLTADGKVKPCLHSNEEIDIKTVLRQGGDVLPIIRKALEIKPKEHHINKGDYTPVNREMVQIGG
ncbi:MULTISPECIES: GTP 3',8-cyclase MoaA [Clostridium]|uniref:GTP 3',8-cyclase n=2 Tax=Clostridium TaxID=1485 RepID=A0A151AKV5_9CLOT|nr:MULTISPECIES: GTP 3',8-cyclase MoaA [Clostridium]KYH28276.1 cyclic pyranopterin monophosphate synthase [Clostridium colicanis DSM 13634]MBE6043663.1 GTP 3',8-cyclase MoaA [Clostridium thermopalmarium]PRR74282.1 Cyclic pyranopterin monophosphate synthase [Clostridium thermopalmarium DSM 5974]PVZ22070.1 cyclic pyranopterin phosphate synthase [Clostridium thermopalmarium DSM 5974]